MLYSSTTMKSLYETSPAPSLSIEPITSSAWNMRYISRNSCIKKIQINLNLRITFLREHIQIMNEWGLEKFDVSEHYKYNCQSLVNVNPFIFANGRENEHVMGP
mgnify:CR=1 FL=1